MALPKINVTKDDDSYTFHIPFPKGYPNTPFKRAAGEVGNMIIGIKRDVKSFGKGLTSTPLYDILDHRPVVLHLFAFYMNNNKREFAHVITSTEASIFKGLGRKMLCYGLNLIIEEERLDPADCSLTLEAGGGRCITDTPEYALGTEEFLAYFKRNWRTMWDEIMAGESVAAQKSELSKLYCDVQENLKLVKYYETLGLKAIMEGNGLSVFMYAPLETVLHLCRTSVMPSKKRLLDESTSPAMEELAKKKMRK
jgi:hypothetical protein